MEKIDRFIRILDKISHASDIDKLRITFDEITDSYGLTSIAYYACSGMRAEQPKLITNYNQSWIDRYVSQDYFLVDPVLSELKRSIMPIEWSRIATNSKFSTRFFGEAKEFGIGRNGLTLPIRGLDGNFALVSITSDFTDSEWKNDKYRLMCDFQVISHAIHAQVISFYIPRIANINITLTRRETQCLQWASRGKTSDDIAIILGISERVIRSYYESSRYKLNAVNKNQAVAKALSLGLIQPEVV